MEKGKKEGRKKGGKKSVNHLRWFFQRGGGRLREMDPPECAKVGMGGKDSPGQSRTGKVCRKEQATGHAACPVLLWGPPCPLSADVHFRLLCLREL